MDLKSFQNHFSNFLYARSPKKNAVTWIPVAFVQDARIESGLRVYRNNLLVTLVDALGDTFPCIKQFFGDEFYNVAKDFLYTFPSTNSDLNTYGSEFSTFLRNSSYENKDFLTNLAELEWHWEQCLYAKEDEALSKEEALNFIQDKGDEAQFKLRDSAVIFQNNYDVFPQWQELRLHQRLDGQIKERTSTEKFYFLWKDNSDRKIQEIEKPLLDFVIALKNAKSLLQISNKTPEKIMDCLLLALERGWIKVDQ